MGGDSRVQEPSSPDLLVPRTTSTHPRAHTTHPCTPLSTTCLQTCCLVGSASTSDPCSHHGWAAGRRLEGPGTGRHSGLGRTGSQRCPTQASYSEMVRLAATKPLCGTICWGRWPRCLGSHRGQPRAAAPGTLRPVQHWFPGQWPAPHLGVGPKDEEGPGGPALA